MSRLEVSRFRVVQGSSWDVNWTVYFALARKRQLVKSTVAVHERWVRVAWCGLEREDGSSAMDLLVADVMMCNALVDFFRCKILFVD